MIKLQDFARQQGVTDRAIQKHLKNCENELLGHFERKGPNGTWLDEYAQDFIRERMKQQPIVVAEEDPRVERLQAELDDVRLQLKDKDRMLYRLIDQNQQLQLEAGKIRALEADNEAARERAAEAERRADVADQQRRDVEFTIEKLQSDLEMSEKGRSEAELRAQSAEDIAEINAQEAERAKAEAEAARAELDAIKNRSFWKRLFNK